MNQKFDTCERQYLPSRDMSSLKSPFQPKVSKILAPFPQERSAIQWLRWLPCPLPERKGLAGSDDLVPCFGKEM